MTQPNFLQVANSLKYASALCVENPEWSSSRIYGGKLEAAAEMFDKATRETDRTYTDWRLILGEELKAFRDMRLEYDRVCELCDEHGYDDFPHRKIVYTERQLLMELIQSMVDYLEAKGDEWDWIEPRKNGLSKMMSAAEERKKEADRLYQTYAISVKRRVTAYDHGVGLVREYLRDARGDAGSKHPGLQKAQLDII